MDSVVAAAFEGKTGRNYRRSVETRNGFETLDDGAIKAFNLRGGIVFGADQPELHGKEAVGIKAGIGVEEF